MNTLINIDNYEEIMFHLVEDDFDETTRTDLLRQIESDGLFKFEWESWQKTKFVDPLENYAIESNELTEKIILIAEPKPTGKKRLFYYWAAAASILLLIGTLFLLTIDFSSTPNLEVAETVKKSPKPEKIAITPVQNQSAPIVILNQKVIRSQKREKQTIPVLVDSNTFIPTVNSLAEIQLVIDSVPVKTNELAKAMETKPRYTITIETTPIMDNDKQNNDLAQSRKVNIGKLFTNTRLFLQRKSNGEPEKLILMGDENNYVCINLNYSEK